MHCDICETPMRERRATAEAPYYYTLAGLPHVGLAGIAVYHCASCNLDVPVIPRAGELHRVIAEAFVRTPGPLRGVELRFLRKNAGFPAQKFAALLAVDPAHLSRVENGKQKALGPSTDRLARAIVTAASRGADVRELLLKEAAARVEEKKRATTCLGMTTTFKLEKNHWKAAA